jgi:hypothetical protein
VSRSYRVESNYGTVGKATRLYTKEIRGDQYDQLLITLIKVGDQYAQLLIKLIKMSWRTKPDHVIRLSFLSGKLP